MKLSIVIVSYNCREYLRECIDSIKTYPPSCEYEIIVVDNASGDGTAQMLAGEYPDIKSVINEDNAGFARGNNIGIDLAEGEFMLLLNPDTRVLEHSIDFLISALNKRADVAIAGCRVLSDNSSVQPFIFGDDPKISYLLRRALVMATRGRYVHDWEATDVLEVDWVTGAAMMTRAKAIKDAGGFDENMFLYFEDNELAYRVRKKGWKVIYYPHAEIIHHGGKSLARDDPKRKDAYYESLSYFYHKHFSPAANMALPVFTRLYRSLLEKRSAGKIREQG